MFMDGHKPYFSNTTLEFDLSSYQEVHEVHLPNTGDGWFGVDVCIQLADRAEGVFITITTKSFGNEQQKWKTSIVDLDVGFTLMQSQLIT